MALSEDESCGLARVTSDDRIVRRLAPCGKQCSLAAQSIPTAPSGCSDCDNASR